MKARMQGHDWIFWVNGLGCAAGGVIPVVSARAGEPSPTAHGFAAGTLLGTALLILIPESAAVLGHEVGLAILCGFLALYALDRWLLTAEIGHGPGHAEPGHAHHVGTLAIAGFSAHALADGAALGVASFRPDVGMPVLLGVLFHEVPAKYVFARLLVASGTKRVWVLGAVVFLAALIIASAYATRSLSQSLPSITVPVGLAVSGGMFLYLSTAELLPREHDATGKSSRAVIAFFAGTGVAYLAHWIGTYWMGSHA
jgi:zinc transporter ZupT